MGGKSIRKCEVCGVRRRHANSNIFLARFPLDPARCRLWVKLTGNEDLAYLPIKSLNENKFICGSHFPKSAFNKKGNRLERNAVPSLNLNIPLSDEILLSFPISDAAHEKISKDYGSKTRERKERSKNGMDEVQASRDNTDDDHRLKDNAVLTEWRDDEVVDDLEVGVIDDTEQPKEDGPFSWQKFKEDAVSLDEKQCAGDADEVKFISKAQPVPDLCDPEDIQTQPEFSCNVCNEPVTGFRYACVQCRDWDLCGACEARGEHATHYVLRVPPHKTHEETHMVLTALRELLDGMALHGEPNVAVIKDEVKTEDPSCEDFPSQAQREQLEDPLNVDTNNLPQDRVADTGQASKGEQRPGSVDPAASDEEIYDEVQYLESESESESSVTTIKDTVSIVDVRTETTPATRLKRKHLHRRDRHEIPPKIQKQYNQEIKFHYEKNTSKATQAETTYLIDTSTSSDNLMAPHTQKDDLIVLDDGSNIVLPPNSIVIECPNEMRVTKMLELSSLSFNADADETQTLDGQLLQVIDCSKQLCVNMTRLSEDEMRASTGLQGGKR